jgi:hypothetical protein
MPDAGAQLGDGGSTNRSRDRHRSGQPDGGVFRDVADPSRYLQTFIVGSWVEPSGSTGA